MNQEPQKSAPESADRGSDPLSFFHQKRVLLPTAILGLLGTVLTWFVPFLGSLAFLPPFLAVYAFGHWLFPKLEEGPEIESGVMSGYAYQEKANKRWQIIMVAAFISALNYFLLSFYWQDHH